MKPSLRLLVFAAALGVGGLFAMPVAHAAPTAQISNVFQGPCQASVCDAKIDKVLDDGAIAADQIQIQVSANSSVGLTSLRIEARFGTSGAWSCLRHWDVTSSTYTTRYNWTTSAWPEYCPDGSANGLTKNGSYQLRLVARESVSDASTVSSPFTVKLNNAPSVPEWAAQPSVEGANEGDPLVQLRWRRVAEPDVREYHYVRTAPDGSQSEFAVSASRPGGQGCDTDGDQIVCYDDYFPTSDYAGDYQYELFALRYSPGAGTPCVLPPAGNCVAGKLTGAREANVPPPPAPPTPDGKVKPSTRPATKRTGGSHVLGSQVDKPSYCDFYCGSYGKTLKYGDHPVVVVPNETPAPDGGNKTLAGGFTGSSDSNGTDTGRMWKSLAAGLLLMLAAVHVSRLLRKA